MDEKILVVIKSFSSGIKLILDPEVDFEILIKEIGKKFAEGRQFFGNAKMAISIEGRTLSEVEEIRVLETIHINSNLNVFCILGHDDVQDHHYIKALKHLENRLKHEEEATHFFKGGLSDGERLEVDNAIVILGDVNPGCSIVSSGSIIILGGLYGEAVCGMGDKYGEPFIIALEMAPEKMSISGVEYIPPVKPKWGIKHKISPQIAYCKDGKLQIEVVSKSVLETVYAL